MNLKVAILSPILGAGGIAGGGYLTKYLVSNRDKPNMEKLVADKEIPLMGEYIIKNVDGQKWQICYELNTPEKDGRLLSVDKCQKLLEEFGEEMKEKTFQGFKVNKEKIKNVLQRKELLKNLEEELEIESQWEVDEKWKCKRKEISNNEEKLMVICEATKGLESLGYSTFRATR